MTQFNINSPIFKALSPIQLLYSVVLGIRSSTQEFWGDIFQPITLPKDHVSLIWYTYPCIDQGTYCQQPSITVRLIPRKIAFIALVGKLKAKSAVTSSFKSNGSLEFRKLETLWWCSSEASPRLIIQRSIGTVKMCLTVPLSLLVALIFPSESYCQYLWFYSRNLKAYF